MTRMSRRLARVVGPLRRLRQANSGIALVEFAVSLPIFLGVGMYGTEIAYMGSVRMQLSQIAISLADNASRLAQLDNTALTPNVTENDIDSVMYGMMVQGAGISLQQNGRLILSSLQYDIPTTRQFFRWQRCRGDKRYESRYGDQYLRNGLVQTGSVKVGGITILGKFNNKIEGVGSANLPITAMRDSAVMVAEAYYDYKGIFGSTFINPTVLYQQAAFIIRDKRNLDGVSAGTSQSVCPVPNYTSDQYTL